MYAVDRSIVVVKPKEPFLKWLKSTPGYELEISLDQLRSDCTAFLVPEFPDPEDAINYIDDRCLEIFEMELASWYEDRGVWPDNRSLKLFWEWFDVEVHSTLIDLVEGEIARYV